MVVEIVNLIAIISTETIHLEMIIQNFGYTIIDKTLMRHRWQHRQIGAKFQFIMTMKLSLLCLQSIRFVLEKIFMGVTINEHYLQKLYNYIVVALFYGNSIELIERGLINLWYPEHCTIRFFINYTLSGSLVPLAHLFTTTTFPTLFFVQNSKKPIKHNVHRRQNNADSIAKINQKMARSQLASRQRNVGSIPMVCFGFFCHL